MIIDLVLPKLVKKSEGIKDNGKNKTITRFNYRLTLFTFTSLHLKYKRFYLKNKGITVKK